MSGVPSPYPGSAAAYVARCHAAEARVRDLEEQLEALREALTKIASCETHIDGDVVSIARAVLVSSPASERDS